MLRLSRKAAHIRSIRMIRLPTGIAGVVSGVNATPSAGMTVKRIGISCDDVIVGQRVSKVTSSAVEMNVSDSMTTTVDNFDAQVVSLFLLLRR